MIVRISTEGQYRVSSALEAQLNAIDNRIVDAAAASDEAKFRQLLDELISLVRTQGAPIAPDEFVESDVILPPPDTSLEEALEFFQGEGVIPG